MEHHAHIGLYSSWPVRNLLVTILRLNKSLKLAESIMNLHPQQASQYQYQRSSLSTVYTPVVMCRQQFPRIPLSFALNFKAAWSSPQSAGDLYILSYTTLNTIKLQARRIRLFMVHSNVLKPISIVNPTLTTIQSKTWTCFSTLNTLKTLHTSSLNHSHILCHGRKNTLVLALR